MRNKKMFKSVVMFTIVMLLVSGCGKQEEPVTTEPTETVKEVEPEESTEESLESSPTVEETEEPVESTEVEEISESEVETTEEEETTGIEIVEEMDVMMYVQTSANGRSGDNKDFDVVTTFSTNTQVHVTGRTSNDWYRVEQSDGAVYVSGKLLGMDKVVVQQSSGGSNSSGGSSQPASNEQSSGGESSGSAYETTTGTGGSGLGLPSLGGGPGSGGGLGINWE